MDDNAKGQQLRGAEPMPPGFVDEHVILVAERSLAIAKLQFVAREADRLFRGITGAQPPSPRSFRSIASVDIAWLAPAEWLVTGPDTDVAALLRRAYEHAGDLGLGIDLTHARAPFVLTGADARDCLASATPLNVADAAFGEGSVARTPLGETTMFLARLPDQDALPRFRIIVDQTMARYALRMLTPPSPRRLS
jgi:sarcosine oxidase subunit gamma